MWPLYGHREIASSGGVALLDDGDSVVVVDRRLGAPATVVFVGGLVAAILGINAVVWVVLGMRGEDVPPWLLPAFLGGIVVAGGVAALGLVVFRRRRRIDASTLPPMAVFDRAAGLLRDATGAPVAALDEVVVRRQVQTGSSSPRLVAQGAGRTVVLARGNPFAGGLGDLDAQLLHALEGTGVTG